MKSKIKKECISCKKSFPIILSRQTKKFCSLHCYWNWMVGKRKGLMPQISEAKKGLKYKIHKRNPTWFKEDNIPWNKNKKLSEEHRKIVIKNSPFKKGHKPLVTGADWSDRLRKEVGKKISSLWKNPKYRETQSKAIIKGLLKRPTSYEKKISELCIENSLPFIYTGDGRFLINFKNPDFVNKKNKVVIEVFYSWFKIRDYGSVESYKKYCKNKYNSAGWKVIFIDENEVDVGNWKELCLNKILGVKYE